MKKQYPDKQHLWYLKNKERLNEKYGKWHIDHIIPVVSFTYETTEDVGFKKCWDLSNLQPLWAIDNLRKHSRIQGG